MITVFLAHGMIKNGEVQQRKFIHACTWIDLNLHL